jgi:predicted DNA-binding transcriptional regulator AlpA
MDLISNYRRRLVMQTTITSSSQNSITPLYWRLKDLPQLTGLSLRTVNRLRAEGRLPKPDAVFGRAVCFRPETIERWAATGGMASEDAA